MTNQTLPVILVADNIRSLYNVGSLFRIADALRIEALYLCGITGYPRVENDTRPEWVIERAEKELKKTGLAGLASVPFKYFATTKEAVEALKKDGYSIVALEITPKSIDYREASYAFPLAFIVGHETDGVDSAVLPLCNAAIHLPMRGEGKSLNVATGASAFLYFINDRYEKS